MSYAFFCELSALVSVLYMFVYSYKKRELALFCFLLFDAWVFEWAILHMLHEVTYSNSFSTTLGGVPLAIICGWAILLYSLHDQFRHSKSIYKNALSVAVLMVLLDLVLEPVAVRVGLWQWGHAVGYYGLPYNNFFGWFLYAFLVVFALRKFGASRGLAKYMYMFSFITILGLILGLLWYVIPVAAQLVVWWCGFAGIFLHVLRQQSELPKRPLGLMLLFPLLIFLASFAVMALHAEPFSSVQIGVSLLYFICWTWLMLRGRAEPVTQRS